jgi:hypothetical protein
MPHDAVETVLYGEFGKVQLKSDFLVGHALGNERDQLHLAQS